MSRICSTHEEMRNAYKIMVGKPGSKKPSSKPRHIWDNIKMNIE
jgi:hypothetical protein